MPSKNVGSLKRVTIKISILPIINTLYCDCPKNINTLCFGSLGITKK